MSFILDALRKSETERQKQSAPGLVDTRYKVPDKRRNFWIPLLVIILAANALVISFLLLDDTPEQASEVATATVEARVTRSEPARSVPPREVRPLYREAETPKQVARAAEPRSAKPEPEIVDALPEETETLPSLQQLSSGGLVSLPTLHVDIHVYSAEPAQRFVFINMNKYREGDVLKEGPSIEKITETGTVLNHQGNRFTLERE